MDIPHREEGVLRRRLRRESVPGFVEGLPRCVVAMEACCSAHHLGRIFAACGHDVRLMSPEYVRPYVKGDGLTVERQHVQHGTLAV
jgi:transposase